ncbi:MAG: MFS transporter [Dehalococcoidia bacterium]|nr:MFS transporter [Dehalococcoidia bacterium]
MAEQTPPTAAEDDEKPDRVSPIAALKHGQYRLLWSGGLFSGAAQTMQLFVNSYVVYEISGSAFQLGLTGVFAAMPVLLFSLLGGAMADKLDRRRLLTVTQGIRLLPSLFLAVIAAGGGLAVWHIYLVTLLSNTAGIFDRPARQALVSNLVPREHLTNALTLNGIVGQFYNIVGPTIAGFVLAATDPTVSYATNFFLYMLAWFAVLLLKAPPTPARPGRGGYLSMIGEGIEFARGRPVILSLLVLDLFVTGFGSGVFRQLMPVFAKDVFEVGPSGLGLLVSSFALGAFIGSNLLLAAGDFKHKGRVILIALFIHGLALIAFGLVPWFYIVLPITVIAGISDQIGAVVRNAMILLMTPNELRGRMEAIRVTFTATAPPLGSIQGGIVATAIGAPLAVVMGGVVTVVAVTVADRIVPAIRKVTT